MMSKNISRRSFLKGAAAGALGLSTTAMLGASAFAEEQAEDNVVNWSDAADLVIVGGGGAGFSAAIEAARAGSSVLILEKSGLCGGDTLLSGGMIMVGGTQLQKDMGILLSRKISFYQNHQKGCRKRQYNPTCRFCIPAL